MFPRLKDRLGTALDLLVEFSTLGEYGFGVPDAPERTSAPPAGPSAREPGLGGTTLHPPRQGARLGGPGAARPRRNVAGGAAGRVPVALPAARRRSHAGSGVTGSIPARRPRARGPRRAAPSPGQLCLWG